jgi:hypothetical protein
MNKQVIILSSDILSDVVQVSHAVRASSITYDKAWCKSNTPSV